MLTIKVRASDLKGNNGRRVPLIELLVLLFGISDFLNRRTVRSSVERPYGHPAD